MGSSDARRSHAGNIYRMMQRLGIEPGGIAPSARELTYLTAVRECTKCQAGESCRRWLDRGAVSTCLMPDFCPNAGLLFELMLEGLPKREADNHH